MHAFQDESAAALATGITDSIQEVASDLSSEISEQLRSTVEVLVVLCRLECLLMCNSTTLEICGGSLRHLRRLDEQHGHEAPCKVPTSYKCFLIIQWDMLLRLGVKKILENKEAPGSLSLSISTWFPFGS